MITIDEWIVLTEQNWAFWVAGMFALFEFFRWAYGGVEWLAKTFGIETRKSLEQKKWEARLEKAEKDIEEIKKNSDRNVVMFLDHERQVVERFTGIRDEIVAELNRLHDKLDEQKEEFDETNRANIKTDCAMLRDRIASGMRYFSHNRDEDGYVHIGFSDYENMEALFREYFEKGGNGAFRKLYETEFQRFLIDR